MIQKYKIENVNKALLANGILFIQSSIKSSEINAVYVSDDYYLFNDLQTVYRYNKNLLEVFIERYNDFFEISNDSNDLRQDLYNKERLLIFNLSNDDVVIYNLIDKKNIDTISFDKDISIFTKNYVIVTEGKSYTNKNIISCWQILDLARKWLYALPEGFKIRGTVQAIDDVLFFLAYKDNHYQLVTGLDIETGKVVYQNQYEITNERKFISAHAYNFDDKMYYGLGDLYQIFNPKTGDIVVEKKIEECESKVIRPYVNSVYDNKLWFVSGKYDTVKFGCLDLDTQEVEFIQDFPQENDEMFEAPIFHNGKLYLHDSNNVLYVLE